VALVRCGTRDRFVCSGAFASGDKVFGVSTNLRHLCAAIVPGRIDYFRYDWKRSGLWNLLFLAGIVIGGFLVSHWEPAQDVTISDHTRAALARLGLHDFSGLAPREIFTWHALSGTWFYGWLRTRLPH
jgi:uncharacterized protein